MIEVDLLSPASFAARIEVRALLHEIVTRLADIEPAGPTEWLPSTFISGPKHLPIRFRAGASVS